MANNIAKGITEATNKPALKFPKNKTNTKITINNSEILEIVSSILINKEEYLIHYQIKKVALIDLFLGLGPKRVNISIQKKGEEQKAGQTFYQTGSKRIKNSFLSNIQTKGNLFQRLKKKTELLRLIYKN